MTHHKHDSRNQTAPPGWRHHEESTVEAEALTVDARPAACTIILIRFSTGDPDRWRVSAEQTNLDASNPDAISLSSPPDYLVGSNLDASNPDAICLSAP